MIGSLRRGIYAPRPMGIRDRSTAPRSPWQNGHAERLIGSIRRECLDHVIVFSERHLRHVLRSYAHYHNVAEHICRWPRTHPSPDPSRPSEAFFRYRSSADYITIMCGSDLRQRQYGFAHITARCRYRHAPASRQSGSILPAGGQRADGDR